MAKVAVISFPGTNCDEDVVVAIHETTSLHAEVVWYTEYKAGIYDAVILPGGFSYGDWLRAGAIAARTKAIDELRKDVENGVPALGICNGFQMLVEAELLPGALLANESGRFVCKWVKTRVKSPRGPWLRLMKDEQEVHMPVAHGEGRYYINEEEYAKVMANGNPVIYYLKGHNPNGSVHDIAGVGSVNGQVLGLMPHPERASNRGLAPRGFTANGFLFFESLEKSLKEGW